MNEVRCSKCNKLLATQFEGDTVSIKCPRCGTLNSLDRTKLTQSQRTFAPSYGNRMFKI